MSNTLLTSKEVAAQLKIPVYRVQELVKKGKLRSVRMGIRTNRFTQEEIERFIKDSMQGEN